MDIAKLVFGGVILAGIMAESLNKVWLYSVGVVIFIVCLVFAFMLYKIAKENKNGTDLLFIGFSGRTFDLHGLYDGEIPSCPFQKVI